MHGKSRQTGAIPAPADADAQVAATGVRQVLVDGERDGQRVDNFLFGLLKGVPKTHVYRLLRTGQVRINGRRAKPDTRIAGGDLVRVPPVRIAPATEAPRASERSLESLASRIVFEDRNFIAIDKPSGLASHGGSGIRLGAIEQIRQLRPDESLELVHRLDRDTSGVLLFARRRSALTGVQAQIREGRVRKRYLSLLAGRLPQARTFVDVALRKQVLQGGERMVRVDPEGKASRSEFRVLQQHGDFSYVEIVIDTGRTHQIRVHAQHLGAPVAGDDKYGDAEANRRLREHGLRRLFLHAAELAFELPDGTRYHLAAPLPDELARVLDAF
ncbi:MAG TPA: RluA family pseudouridine synthase [Candidatus Saccharimonadia bacterium]|nr:RluA family pseudouridine synthase [Candidatus Saccharimonadia bacterium]